MVEALTGGDDACGSLKPGGVWLLGRENNLAAVVLFLVEYLISSGRFRKGHTVADNDIGVQFPRFDVI